MAGRARGQRQRGGQCCAAKQSRRAETLAAEPAAVDDDHIMVVGCPDGMAAGDRVIVETPDGREMEVEIPDGVSAGEEFEVYVGIDDGDATAEQSETLRPADDGTISVTFTQPGVLGLTFTRNNQTGSTEILAISPSTQALRHRELRPGLILVSVSGASVSGKQDPEIIEMISARPVTLTFKPAGTAQFADGAIALDSYEFKDVTFPNEGALGFTLQAVRGQHVVEPTESTANPDACLGLSAGDTLVAVAGRSVEGQHLEKEVIPAIKRAGRPLVLTFRRAARDGEMYPGLRAEEEARAIVQFRELDLDGSGKLDRAEVLAMGEKLSENWSKADVDKIFKMVDRDKSGQIELAEFLSWWVLYREEQRLLAELNQLKAVPDAEPAAVDDDHIMVVECPDGMTAGDRIIVETPDGGEMEVEIPDGVSAGEEFEVYVGIDDGDVTPVSAPASLASRPLLLSSSASAEEVGPAPEQASRNQVLIHDVDEHDVTRGALVEPRTAEEAGPVPEQASINQVLIHDVEEHDVTRGAFVEPRTASRQDMFKEIQKRQRHEEPEPEPELDDDHCVSFVVPQGKAAGDILLLQLSDGRDAEICIPNGVSPGDEIEIRVGSSAESLVAPEPSDNHASTEELMLRTAAHEASAKRVVDDVQQRLARVISKPVSTKLTKDLQPVIDSTISEGQLDVVAAEALLSQTQGLLKQTQALSPMNAVEQAEEASEDAEDEDKITLTVPDGMVPGDNILLVELDDGEEIEVLVPDNLRPGDKFDILVGPSTTAHDSVKQTPMPTDAAACVPVDARLHEAFESAGRELRTAAQRNDMTALASALKHADLDSADLKTGNTALHWAAVLDHPKIVLALLDAGADSSRLNRNGATPWDLAVGKGGRKLVLQLLDGQRPRFWSEAWAEAADSDNMSLGSSQENREQPAADTSSRMRTTTGTSLGEVASIDHETGQVEVRRDRPAQKRKKPPPARSPCLELEVPGKVLRANVFRKADRQAKGTLTADEARSAVMEIWPSFDLQSEYTRALEQRAYHAAVLDAKAGHIGRKEFRRMLKYIVYFNNHWAVFEDVAQRSQGFLSGEQFRTAAIRLGIKGTRVKPIGHHFAALATTAGGRGPSHAKKVGFDVFCRWCAEQHLSDDPEETDTVEAPSPSRSQRTPPRTNNRPVRKSNSTGGWDRSPPRFSIKPQAVLPLKQEQRPRVSHKVGSVRMAHTGYANGSPSTATGSTPVKIAPAQRTGRARTPERAAPSPSRRGYWLHSTSGHRLPQVTPPRTTSHAEPGSYAVDHHSLSRLATKSNQAGKWTKPTAATARFGHGSIYRDARDIPATPPLAHSQHSDFDRRVQAALKSAVDCTFSA